ncbi:hypothetical protein HDU98_011828 [Podochytrium sp. JEL0797]|nr:hypothetical protein HDU98_011828 [Podochytrium sp. JEL0797]
MLRTLAVVCLLAATTAIAWTYWQMMSDKQSALYAWHPFCMSVFLFASITGAYFPRLALSPKSKRSITLHASLQAIALLAFTAGFAAIYQNKDDHKSPHFTSRHGFMGAVAYVCVLAVMALGAAHKSFPVQVFGSVVKARKWVWVKQTAGFLTLLLVVVTGGIGVWYYAKLEVGVKVAVLGVISFCFVLPILMSKTTATKSTKSKSK